MIKKISPSLEFFLMWNLKECDPISLNINLNKWDIRFFSWPDKWLLLQPTDHRDCCRCSQNIDCHDSSGKGCYLLLPKDNQYDTLHTCIILNLLSNVLSYMQLSGPVSVFAQARQQTWGWSPPLSDKVCIYITCSWWSAWINGTMWLYMTRRTMASYIYLYVVRSEWPG